jgi:hypothetical protein
VRPINPFKAPLNTRNQFKIHVTFILIKITNIAAKTTSKYLKTQMKLNKGEN